MTLTLPDWLFQGIVMKGGVLTIHEDYFLLTGGIERWLYRIARKHAGHQPHGWLFEVSHLHAKSGSLARVSDFAFDLRRIAARQPLPGYRLQIEWENRAELLRILPADLSTGTVINPVKGLGTSGAKAIGTSGAALSAHQARQPPLSLWPETGNPTANLESNKESNFLLLGRGKTPRSAGTGRRGAP